jgi:hypothetical protein
MSGAVDDWPDLMLWLDRVFTQPRLSSTVRIREHVPILKARTAVPIVWAPFESRRAG